MNKRFEKDELILLGGVEYKKFASRDISTEVNFAKNCTYEKDGEVCENPLIEEITAINHSISISKSKVVRIIELASNGTGYKEISEEVGCSLKIVELVAPAIPVEMVKPPPEKKPPSLKIIK